MMDWWELQFARDRERAGCGLWLELRPLRKSHFILGKLYVVAREGK